MIVLDKDNIESAKGKHFVLFFDKKSVNISKNLVKQAFKYDIIGKVFKQDEPFDLKELSKLDKSLSKKEQKIKNLSIFDLLIPVLTPEVNLDIPENLELPHKLYNYQIQGVKFLISNCSALLADQMGTGKTVQSTVALKILFIKGIIKKALVVVPSSLISVWEKHLEEWASELQFVVLNDKKDIRKLLWETNAHIYIVSYDTLKNDFHNEEFKLEQFAKNIDLVLLDEAHNIKNPDAIKTKAVKQISKFAKYRWALSGTPLQNNLEELVSLLEFLFPDKQFNKNLTPEEARKLIQPIMLRRLKKDVLKELPEKLPVIMEKLQLSPSQKQEYDFVLGAEQERITNLIEKHKKSKQFRFILKKNIIHSIQKLRQICNFPSSSSSSPKMERLKEIVKEIVENKEKIIIFTNFYENGVRKIYENLLKEFPESKIAQFHGKMSFKDKKKQVKRFVEDEKCQIFIGTIGSAGEGLTLTVSNYAVFFDMHWNPAKMWQAEDRVHRIGQKNKVVIHNLIMENTIEEKILQKLQEKRKLIETVVDGVKHIKEEEVSLEDLMDFIGIKN
ncbi:MAG: ATP-dependent helicase [Hydrogenothermus sp.]|nr:MAG: ATP-dependent helicase [Hydrogenothermus sp.]